MCEYVCAPAGLMMPPFSCPQSSTFRGSNVLIYNSITPDACTIHLCHTPHLPYLSSRGEKMAVLERLNHWSHYFSSFLHLPFPFSFIYCILSKPFSFALSSPGPGDQLQLDRLLSSGRWSSSGSADIEVYPKTERLFGFNCVPSPEVLEACPVIDHRLNHIRKL